MSRLFRYLLIFALVLTLNFFLPRAMPGDPLAFLQGEGATDAPVLVSPEVRQKLLPYYGLDRPLVEQFGRYLLNTARGDLGFAISFNQPVGLLIVHRLPWTLFLLGFSILFAATVGIILGSLSAWRWKSGTDLGLLLSLLALGSLPEFLVGMGLLLPLGLYLGLFPLMGAQTPFQALAPGPVGFLTHIGDILWHAALPGLTLALAHLPHFYFLMRNSMLNVVKEPYILTARAKGLGERTIVFRHAVKNALLPVAALFGVQVGLIATGAIVVETLFAYPGMGRLMFEAIRARDFPVMQGVFLVMSLFILMANFIADFIYTYFDPRVRVGRSRA